MTKPILEGKTAIVTGSVRGVGQAFAVELASHGADVVVTERTQDDIDATDRVFEEATTEFGALDILVNNAGIFYPFDVMDDSIEDLYEVMEVNLYAAVDCALHAAHEFRLADGEPDEITGANGKILNI